MLARAEGLSVRARETCAAADDADPVRANATAIASAGFMTFVA